MSIEPGGEIGLERHEDVDQFIRVEAGEGEAILDGERHELRDGSAVVIPSGTEHNVVNTSRSDPLRLSRSTRRGSTLTGRSNGRRPTPTPPSTRPPEAARGGGPVQPPRGRARRGRLASDTRNRVIDSRERRTTA
jgi:hypothetical protein